MSFFILLTNAIKVVNVFYFFVPYKVMGLLPTGW